VFDALLNYDFAYLDPQWRGFKFQLNVTNMTDKYLRARQRAHRARHIEV
jgi:hypothetical protein